MVACGRARSHGCEPQPVCAGGEDGRTTPQLRRSDGARAWSCSLTAGPGGPYLRYWAIPDGTIEFAAVVDCEDLSIPGGA